MGADETGPHRMDALAIFMPQRPEPPGPGEQGRPPSLTRHQPFSFTKGPVWRGGPRPASFHRFPPAARDASL
jgi:hypothetical protein